ncbi:MAG: type II toxin-antitoxin system VapC family toxin [Myxococcota bacterium]
MKILLDTHVLLWWLVGDERLSAARRAQIVDADTRVLVSAASGWEIATKHRLGKLPMPAAVVSELPKLLIEQGFETVDITLLHATRAGRLPGDHRDPFDRMLAAQALIEGLPIVSADAALDPFGVERWAP